MAMAIVVGEGTVWTAGQVARHLRIAESTLRSWHRRYGVGPHAARPGQYRRYKADDIARLRRMRDLIQAGTLPSEAARAIDAAGPAARPLAEVLSSVLAATQALDNAGCLTLLENALADVGVVELWEQVCRPALTTVDTGVEECVDTEHVLSWAITAALHRVARPPAESATPPVLLACTATEQHTLGLEALAAALAERGVPVGMLGAAVPTPALVHAATVATPAVVVLWSQQRDTARSDALRALRRFPLLRVTAGPGWPRRRPTGVEHADDLRTALTLSGS
jgi:MerR family transcriptional regulator, light-induced transcriptional regulator